MITEPGKSIFDDDPDVNKVVPLFIKAHRNALGKIEQAIGERNLPKVIQVCRKCYGSSLSFGFQELAAVYRELKLASETKRWSQAETAMQQADETLDRIYQIYQ